LLFEKADEPSDQASLPKLSNSNQYITCKAHSCELYSKIGETQ
jgi:hypothetical protein